MENSCCPNLVMPDMRKKIIRIHMKHGVLNEIFSQALTQTIDFFRVQNISRIGHNNYRMPNMLKKSVLCRNKSSGKSQFEVNLRCWPPSWNRGIRPHNLARTARKRDVPHLKTGIYNFSDPAPPTHTGFALPLFSLLKMGSKSEIFGKRERNVIKFVFFVYIWWSVVGYRSFFSPGQTH